MLVSNNSIGKDAWLKGFSKSSKRVYRNGYEKFIEFMKQTDARAQIIAIENIVFILPLSYQLLESFHLYI